MTKRRVAIGLLLGLTVLAAAPQVARAAGITRCYADCPVELTGCRDTFIRGRFYRDCMRRIVYACHHAGGCGAVMPPPPTDRCRDNVFCPLGRPVCDMGKLRCVPEPSLAPGNYTITFCASGTVTIPCQPVGTFPIFAFNAFKQAMQSALGQFLSANGAAGCTFGGGQTERAEGGLNVTFSATCTDPDSGTTVSESVVIQVRP